MKVAWTLRARRDLDAIHAFIPQHDRVAAARWVGRLRERVSTAALAPLAGRIVPEFERADVREVFLRTYRIVYRVAADELHVLTVFEGHRRLVPDVPAAATDALD